MLILTLRQQFVLALLSSLKGIIFMSIPYVILSIIFLLGCMALITVILLQKKRAGGIGSVAGMGNADTYWDKNKGRSMEGALEKWTKIGGAVFFIGSIVICLVAGS